LKVDPKKRMLFNPQESIEFQGNTGPFVQYTYARIAAILRKGSSMGIDYLKGDVNKTGDLHVTEKNLIVAMSKYPSALKEAADGFSPSLIVQYVYDLAKAYNRFYAEVSIFNEEDKDALAFRIHLSYATSNLIKKNMLLLGIDVPERM